MLRLPARARTFSIGLALATASLGMVPSLPASASGAAITWNVQAGNVYPSFADASQEITTFYNARTFVHPGDRVLFTPVGAHTVTFNPIRVPGVPTFAYADPTFPPGHPTGNTLGLANRPGGALLNSGAIATPGVGGPPALPTFTLNIGDDAAGASGGDSATRAKGEAEGGGTTYQYFCMFHRDMTGFITVLPGGTRLPYTAEQNDTRADNAKKVDIARGTAALRKASRDAEDNHVAAGLGVSSVQHAGATSILRFAPASIRIHVGDSVTFTNQDLNAPHTVTFGTELPDTSGVGPGFVSYGGTTVSTTADQVNSGWLISQQLIDYVNAAGSLLPLGYTPVREVTFTFTKADTYHYFCALHDFLGMVGTVIVSNDDSASG
jgi:plastocyanin